MPFVQRPAKPDLYYEIDDFTDPWSNAPFLILQHGYGRSSQFWFQWVPYLCRYFKVVRPDLRGLGRSGKNFDFATGLNPEEYVGDIHAIVRLLGGQPVHYCGESIGGILGLAFAGAYPKLVRSLSLVSAPVFFSEGARKDYACGYASWPEAVRQMGPEPWLKQTNTSTRFPPDMPTGFLNWYNENVAAAGVEMLAQMAEFALGTDVTPYSLEGGGTGPLPLSLGWRYRQPGAESGAAETCAEHTLPASADSVPHDPLHQAGALFTSGSKLCRIG